VPEAARGSYDRAVARLENSDGLEPGERWRVLDEAAKAGVPGGGEVGPGRWPEGLNATPNKGMLRSMLLPPPGSSPATPRTPSPTGTRSKPHRGKRRPPRPPTSVGSLIIILN